MGHSHAESGENTYAACGLRMPESRSTAFFSAAVQTRLWAKRISWMRKIAHPQRPRSPIVPIARFARSVASNLRRYHLYHRTVAELSALGDRELADLGIDRTDIRRIARTSTI